MSRFVSLFIARLLAICEPLSIPMQVGGQRFLDLAVGIEGVSYRASKFEQIAGSYIENSGLRNLSYSSAGTSPITGGDSAVELVPELEASRRRHTGELGSVVALLRPRLQRHQPVNAAPGDVSIAVRSGTERQVKERLVAQKGKVRTDVASPVRQDADWPSPFQLVTVVEELGAEPNGTAFAITTGAAPELDSSNLVVGRVVDGMDVLQRLAELPTVRPNQDSPFFKAAKVDTFSPGGMACRACDLTCSEF